MFVLAFWTETSETSIIDESFVVDKTMLSDPRKVGMVKYGDMQKKPPKLGWKAYPARVLAVSDSKSVLSKREESFLQSFASTSSCSGNEKKTRADRKKRVFSSDEEEEMQMNTDNPKNMDKEKQRKRQAAERRAMTSIISELGSSSDDDEVLNNSHARLTQRIKALEQSEAELKSQVRKLKKQNLLLQEGLGDRLEQAVKDAIQKTSTCSPKGRQELPALPSAQPSHSIDRSRDTEHSQPCDEGAGIKSHVKQHLSPMVLQQISRAKDMGKMTCQLMTSMFSAKEMATCLVTGKRLKVEDRDRPVLDQEKVDYIIGTVLEQFKDARPGEVRAKMAQKCKDVRASQKRLAASKEKKEDNP